MLINEFMASTVLIGLGVLTFLLPTQGMTFPILIGLLVAMRRALPQFTSIVAASIDLQKWRRGLEVLDGSVVRVSRPSGFEVSHSMSP